jgi:hypothetical protein
VKTIREVFPLVGLVGGPIDPLVAAKAANIEPAIKN